LVIFVGLGLLFGVAQAPSASADGTISISWDRPAGPGQPPITWRTFDGPGPIDVYVTLNGMSSSIQAQEVSLVMSTNPFCVFNRDTIPDAWRFDEGGCQAGRSCFTGKGLRELLGGQPLEPGYLSISDVAGSPDLQTIRFVLAELYPAVMHPDPTKSYTLFHLRLDHGLSVAGPSTGSGCGHADDEVYLALSRASYLDSEGNEIPWTWTYPDWIGSKGASDARAHGVLCTHSEAPSPSLLSRFGDTIQSALDPCDLPVPTDATSWGRLKSVYR
jgi:hypothetical protein